ncbi:MAG: hypothetical protein AAFX87_11110 [Bacteroidota bacterium]
MNYFSGSFKILTLKSDVIVSKPKFNTLFSLGFFLAAAYTFFFISLIYILNNPLKFEWYHVAGTVILGPIALGVTVRTLVGYKIVTISKEKVKINYKFRFSKKQLNLKDLELWKETTIKTLSAPYKELEMKFNNGKKLKLSMQEHTDYKKVVNYLNKKCAKKRQS